MTPNPLLFGGMGLLLLAVALLWTARWEGRRRRRLFPPSSARGQDREGPNLDDVIDQSPFSIWITDSRGTVIRHNGASQRLFGIRDDDPFLGRYNLLQDERLTDQRLQPSIAMVYRDGHPVTLEAELDLNLSLKTLLPEARPKLVEMTISPLRSPGGRVSGAMVHHRDLSEERALEAQLRESTKMEAIGRLAGGVAHDFNNLLTAISGYADLALMQVREGSSLWRDLREVRKAAERASTMTRQLLAFSRRQVLKPRILDVNKQIQDLLPLLQRLLGEDIRIETELDPKLPRIQADKGQIDQVLLNLAVNARDALPDGGRIEITTRGEVERPGSSEERMLLIFRDDGRGIPEELQNHIFEPFFTTKSEGEGTGLGLATVYGIVRQHGGLIQCRSKLGEGTSFVISLPSAGSRSDDLDSSKLLSLGLEGGKETILLAEDEPSVREFVTRTLVQLGYQVLEAESGPQALELLLEYTTEVDLLITDVVMPGMSGRELARRARNHQSEIALLFISGYTPEAVRLEGESDLDRIFLPKPFGPGTLARRVRLILDHQRSTDSSGRRASPVVS